MYLRRNMGYMVFRGDQRLAFVKEVLSRSIIYFVWA